MSVIIPPNMEIAGEFTEFGDTTDVLQGTGYGTIAHLRVVSKVCPLTAQVLLTQMLVRVVTAGSDQMYFSLRRHGQDVDKGFRKIPGVAFDQNPRFEVGLILDGGLIEIVAWNKSGTTEPGAGAGATIQVQCGFVGFVLRQKDKLAILSSYRKQLEA